MKAFLGLLLFCCLFGINRGQVTVAQATGTWADDGTNSALNAACCPPATLALAAGTGTTMSAAGTWGTATACTTNGIKSGTFTAANQAYASNTLPIPFSYTYNFATTGTGQTLVSKTDGAAAAPPAAAVNGVLTWNFNIGAGTTCTVDLTGPSTFRKADPTTWVGTYYAATAPTVASCCFPVVAPDSATSTFKIAGTAAPYTVTWTWDTVTAASATACRALGLSGPASVTVPAASVTTSATSSMSFNGLTTTTITTASNDVLSSATASIWTYITNGQSCAYNLKKTSSSATNLYISFAGLILFFVAYL